MRFGLIVPQSWREDLEGRDFETMAAVARRAEELGFDSVWLYDHLQTRAGNPERVLECWTSLAALPRYADVCNLTDSFEPAYYRHKLDVLRAHCETAGRDYAEIEKTASFTLTTRDRVDFDALETAGIERVILYVDPPKDLEKVSDTIGV
jgi:hypothetical protein